MLCGLGSVGRRSGVVARWRRWRVWGLGFGSSVGCDSVVAVVVVVIVTECCGSGLGLGVGALALVVGCALALVKGLGCPRLRLCWPILGRRYPAGRYVGRSGGYMGPSWGNLGPS